MGPRPEQRHRVDFPVFLSWEQKNGVVHRVPGRCVDLSPSGARLETRDRLEPRTTIAVQSEQYGRMGMASIRYCTRHGMKYIVGLEFSAVSGLSDPVRKKIMENVLRPQAALELQQRQE
jgi:hypothetical protein